MNREEKTEKHMKADFKLPLGIIKLFLAGGRVLELLKRIRKEACFFFFFDFTSKRATQEALQYSY